MTKQYRVNITVEHNVDIIVDAENEAEAERVAREDNLDAEIELDYGKEVTVTGIDCLDDDDNDDTDTETTNALSQ